jgi:hypothetical protein
MASTGHDNARFYRKSRPPGWLSGQDRNMGPVGPQKAPLGPERTDSNGRRLGGPVQEVASGSTKDDRASLGFGQHLKAHDLRATGRVGYARPREARRPLRPGKGALFRSGWTSLPTSTPSAHHHAERQISVLMRRDKKRQTEMRTNPSPGMVTADFTLRSVAVPVQPAESRGWSIDQGYKRRAYDQRS